MTEFLENYVFCPKHSQLVPRAFCQVCKVEDCPSRPKDENGDHRIKK